MFEKNKSFQSQIPLATDIISSLKKAQLDLKNEKVR